MISHEMNGGRDHSAKRRKLSMSENKAPEQLVTTSKQLRLLLTFQQNDTLQIQTNLKQFKSFLEIIAHTEDKSKTRKEQDILKNYIRSQISTNYADSESNVSLPELMRTWDFAVQIRSDPVTSLIISVIALLLKTISSLIEFREDGIQICRTILQQAQLRLLSKGLSSPKQKEHIISPCLRLLTEVVSFDGGTLAKQAYDNRTFTFDSKVIARCLSLWKPDFDEKRPSVRLNTVRYLLAQLRFQPSQVKAELLAYGPVFRSLFEHLKHDPRSIVQDVFSNLRTFVINDSHIPSREKSYIFYEQNLINITSLLRQETQPNPEQSDEPSISQLAHSFLTLICTDLSAGVIRAPTGWYPPGIDKATDDIDGEGEEDRVQEIDLGLDSIPWYNAYESHVPVRNKIFAAFAQSLRPFASNQENDLLLAMFRAAPEIVADYFFKKTTFAFDPKLTATWIGYASFMFSVISMQIPKYFGSTQGFHRLPPPISVVIENIMPQPLNQKVLTRCLNQSCELITFFTLQILIAAFRKLRDVLTMFREASGAHGPLWDEAAERLVSHFCMRCPKMKDLILAYRQTSADKSLYIEAILQVLSLCYELTPQIALEGRLDVSNQLSRALKEYESILGLKQTSLNDHSETELGALSVFELNHLLQISRHSADMRWWNKPEKLNLSPFTVLLKLVSTNQPEDVPSNMRSLLESILREHDIVQGNTAWSSTDALIASLTPTNMWQPSDTLFEFLDDTFTRCVKKPIKYIDDYENLTRKFQQSELGPVSLVHFVLAEQWPFVLGRKKDLANIAIWLGRFIRTSRVIGEDEAILSKLLTSLVESGEDSKVQSCLRNVDEDPIYGLFPSRLAKDPITNISKEFSGAISSDNYIPPIDINGMIPPAEADDHSGLHRWRKEPDIPTAIRGGAISSLINCLSSSYPEIRRLAHTQLHEICLKVQTFKKSQFTDSPQIYLLLGILVNTTTHLVAEGQNIPYICTSYAAHALRIIMNPLHPLYDKVCGYHCRGPSWDIDRLPSYWTHEILFQPPTLSNSLVSAQNTFNDIKDHLRKGERNEHNMSLSFLLNFIYDGLQTSEDLEILRKKGTFEPLLALIHDPFPPKWVEEVILRIVWRTTCIEGGSTILITRHGIVASVAELISRRGNAAHKDLDSAWSRSADSKMAEGWRLRSTDGLKQLLRRLWDTCDQERVNSWSHNRIEHTILAIKS